MPWDLWDPFEEIERMRKKMRKLMERFGETMEEKTYGFPLDISETDDELIVKAELPDFNKDEISIKASENSLDISASRKEKKIEKTGKVYKAEKKFGGVRRYVTLPAPVKIDDVRTSFDSGVLTIRLKKAKAGKKTKEIKLK
ncbi:MAG: Hsp20/alpha crystallin family protein [Candidatus Aenigmarchaeota archaeon]|nr:Hsp20/alpha crystallin family protein [Candidatus Aenigmarchaeota archaeon]